VRAEGKSMAFYSHVVRVVDETAGLATAAQIELEFDPSYQTLALHHLKVVRAGKAINKLDRDRIRVLQRETQLERQMYDGRVTLSVVLDDVRIGDEIDFAYTVRGANPVFDGKFNQADWMTSHRGPVALYQVRLLAPQERAIQLRSYATDAQVDSNVRGGTRETILRRESIPQFRPDSGAPSHVAALHQVHFTEFADWADVSRWGQALFDLRSGDASLDRKAAELRERSADRSVQVEAALDFVQKEVRYFGTEVGIGSHRPTAPDKVLSQRFGDCKDKVGLLIALLRRMDIRAEPVLVSTYLRTKTNTQIASPLPFDHVIARVHVDGSTYFLDATRTHQTGRIANRQLLGMGQGLVLAPDTTSLTALPSVYDAERMSVVDTVRVERFTEDPTLESRITYRGDLAELIRTAIASRGQKDVAASATAVYFKIYPKLQTRAPLKFEDVAGDDAVTLVQSFTIPNFWSLPEEKLLQAEFLHWSLIDALTVPKAETRRDPLLYQYPGVYRQTIVLDLPEDVFKEPATQRFEEGDSHFRLLSTIDATRRRVEYAAQVRIGNEQVEPSEWSAYVAKLGKVLPQMGVRATVATIPLGALESVSRELKATETALVQRRTKAVTETQRAALFRSVVLTAQLGGGRLPRDLEAQVLKARGVQYDNLGRFSDAQKDFARALELSADSNEIQNAAAVNALQLRRYDQAITLTSQVLQAQPGNSDALNTRALARYFANDLPAAQADWKDLLKDRSAVRRGYPIVWLSMAMRQRKEDAAALDAAYPKDQLPSEWPRQLIEMAWGRTTPDSVIEAAKSSKTPVEALCEAYFYIGEKYYTEGDVGRATEFWRKAADQGVVEFLEDGAARSRLATISAR
jgi:lipoprotein NlpI/transglutaminase-like putative cysteine protease